MATSYQRAGYGSGEGQNRIEFALEAMYMWYGDETPRCHICTVHTDHGVNVKITDHWTDGTGTLTRTLCETCAKNALFLLPSIEQLLNKLI